MNAHSPEAVAAYPDDPSDPTDRYGRIDADRTAFDAGRLSAVRPFGVADRETGDTKFWKREAGAMLRYADEHLEDRVILSDRIDRAQKALSTGNAAWAQAILAEPFYYFTDDCNEWDQIQAAERERKVAEVKAAVLALSPSPLVSTREALARVLDEHAGTYAFTRSAVSEVFDDPELQATYERTHAESALADQVKHLHAADALLQSGVVVERGVVEAEIREELDEQAAALSEAGDTPWDEAVSRHFDPIYDAKLNEVLNKYFDMGTVAEIKEQIGSRGDSKRKWVG